MKRTDTTQINARIPSDEALKIKKDILETGALLESYVLEALTHFRKSLPIDERRNRFKGVQKAAGRPVSA